jgi:DNA repair metallo-beta-lactamase
MLFVPVQVAFRPTGWTAAATQRGRSSRGRRLQKGTLIQYQVAAGTLLPCAAQILCSACCFTRILLNLVVSAGGVDVIEFEGLVLILSIPVQVPYSEHSSFEELRDMVAALQVLPTCFPPSAGS